MVTLVYFGISQYYFGVLYYIYLLKYFERKNVNLFAAISTWFSYVFLIQAKNGTINDHIKVFNNIFVVGILRGLGGIGIGYFIGLFYKEYKYRINNAKLSKMTTIFINVLEIYLFSWSLYYLILHRISCNNNIIFILYFTILFNLFLFKKGFFTKLLDNDFSVILGRYSYSIYSIHSFIFIVLRNTFWKNHKEFIFTYPMLNVIITIILVFVFAVLTYQFVEKPSAKYLNKKFFSDTNNMW